MAPMLGAIVKAVFTACVFGGAAYAGVGLSRLVVQHVTCLATQPGKPEPRLVYFVAGAALFGLALDLRGMDVQSLAMAAVLGVFFVACWHSAIAYGAMPDLFILVPLGAIVLSSLVTQNWPVLFSIFAVFAPVALLAYLSKGANLGWDDAKLAALGGAILGAEAALVSFAAAGVAAVVVAWLRKQTRHPIAFGPYLISAVALSLLWNFAP
jgi:prepilin signal peptidase PulO-like enzyme (type II secretory pathway)